MKRTRVRFTVEVDLDGVFGWNHEPQDFANTFRKELEQRVPHYHPTVSKAKIIRPIAVFRDFEFRLFRVRRTKLYVGWEVVLLGWVITWQSGEDWKRA